MASELGAGLVASLPTQLVKGQQPDRSDLNDLSDCRALIRQSTERLTKAREREKGNKIKRGKSS